MQFPVAAGAAFERVAPTPLFIALAKDSAGKYNPITVAWCMRTSHDPPMLALSVHPKRHSHEAIRGSREFVVAFASVEQAGDAKFIGTQSGREVDKLAACGLAVQPATRIDSMILEDAVANFECVLESEIETGDHTIFIGRVVAAHVNRDALPGLYMLSDARIGHAAEG